MEAYIQALITSAGVIMGVWGFFKVVRDIKKTNDDEVKRQDRIDKAVKMVEDNAESWNKGLTDVYAERDTIVKRYDGRLDEMEGKIQQLYSMVVLLIKAQDATFEEQVKNGANGEIKKMHDELNNFIYAEIGK
jgi:ClpP class serine protease